MAWRDTLFALQQELAQVRAERQREIKAEEEERRRQRDELFRMRESLGVTELLGEMNSILLAGQGKLETTSSWENVEDDGEDEDPFTTLEGDEEDGDYISSVLTWEEDGEREIAVDLGLAEEGTYLQVNGIDIRLEREALEQALVQAFQEELEL